jgi:ABC-type Na+ efflux pump permease subunit
MVKNKERGITLISLIITIIVMIILSGITISSLKKSKMIYSPDIVTGFSKNIVTDTEKNVNDVNSGKWSNVINKKGIEKPVGER